MSSRVSSLLWVYTRRTDVFHTSMDRSVQLRYWRCVSGASPPVKRIACILDYLLMHASIPYPVPRVEEVYVYPGMVAEYDVEENVEIVKLRCDRCSLVEVAALFPREANTSLDYATVQRVLSRRNPALLYPTGLPKDAVKMIRYSVLSALLSRARSYVDAVALLERARDAVLAPLSEIEESCRPAL